MSINVSGEMCSTVESAELPMDGVDIENVNALSHSSAMEEEDSLHEENTTSPNFLKVNDSLSIQNKDVDETSQASSNSLEKQIIMNDSEPLTKTDEWLDLLGSGDLRKRVIKPGVGEDSRPERGDWIVANIVCRKSSGDVVDNIENFELRLGDIDIVPGLDLAIALMQEGEQAEIQVPSRLAFGKHGRLPDIPPNDDLKYEVELIRVSKKDDEKLTVSERLRLGNEKKSRGNFWYSNENYLNAISCYQRACLYLDGIHDGSDNPPEVLQAILNSRIAVNNNLAAAHIKMEAYDIALKSLNFVIAMQPKNVKAHFRKGKILAAKGMVSEAINEMKIAMKLEPDSKVTQVELANLLRKKRMEDNKQKAMYKRMMGLNNLKSNSPKQNSWRKWSVMAGSVLAVAVAFAAFRQYHTG